MLKGGDNFVGGFGLGEKENFVMNCGVEDMSLVCCFVKMCWLSFGCCFKIMVVLN